jgi:uncharacterized cupredoxin-like copper-binding protein
LNPSRLSIVALVVAAPFAFGACGSDNKKSSSSTGTTTTEAAAPSGKAATTVNVSETEFKLGPANPKIPKAGTVEFKVKNDGQVVHALEVEGPNGEVKTANIDPGKTATLKADLSKPGKYEWYCPVDSHKQQGMKGEITVAGGGSGAGSSSSTDTSSNSGGGSSGY